jgi:hypothetical protein
MKERLIDASPSKPAGKAELGIIPNTITVITEQGLYNVTSRLLFLMSHNQFR